MHSLVNPPAKGGNDDGLPDLSSLVDEHMRDVAEEAAPAGADKGDKKDAADKGRTRSRSPRLGGGSGGTGVGATDGLRAPEPSPDGTTPASKSEDGGDDKRAEGDEIAARAETSLTRASRRLTAKQPEAGPSKEQSKK